MMFEMSFGLHHEGANIREVVNKSLAEGKVTKDLAEKGENFYLPLKFGDYLLELIS